MSPPVVVLATVGDGRDDALRGVGTAGDMLALVLELLSVRLWRGGAMRVSVGRGELETESRDEA